MTRMVKPYAKLYIPAWMAVYDRLRHARGRPFKTTLLSEELGIPRTSVNQALLALRVKGLVRKTSNGYVYDVFQTKPVSNGEVPCYSCGSKSYKTVSVAVAGSEKLLCLRCLSHIVELALRITDRLKNLEGGNIQRHTKREKAAIYGRFVGRLISLVGRRGRVCATSLGLRHGLSKREVRRVLVKMAPKMGWIIERRSGHLYVRHGGSLREPEQVIAPTIDGQG